MRFAILSDVHGNLEALAAVEAAIAVAGPDRVVCLGDTVGYGASPAACCEHVRRVAMVTLLGNHDAAVAGRMEYGSYYDAAREALEWTRRQLASEHVQWLGSLPYMHRVGDVAFSHGSPVQPESYGYVFGMDHARHLAPHFDALAGVTFVGHSHLCRVFAFERGGGVEQASGTRLWLDPARKYVVSAGSVGQPRDCDSRACFVTYDAEERLLEFHRVPYDVASAARRIFAAPLALKFGRRLFLGV